MAIFPLEVFTKDNAITGFNDKYESSVIARKFAGMPKGVYVGFVPVAAPSPGTTVTLETSTVEGYSLLKLPSDTDPAGIDIVTDSSIVLDFAGQPAGDFPIHIVARASYTADGSTATSAEIFTRSATTVAFDEVLICEVSGTATNLSVAYDASLGERDAPIAYDNVDFGFMPGGSVEDLADAVDVVNEVTAARVGLDSTVYESLSGRLAGDQSAESMARRLGLVLTALRSNDYLLQSGESSINVSGSFSEVNRDHGPLVTLDGQGSESSQGALADPNDTTRNVAIIQDTSTGYRLMDSNSSRLIVFGRVAGPEEVVVSGTVSYTNAQKSVTITDGNATVELEEGDTVLGADGLYYEVSTIFNDTQIELVDEYQGTTAQSASVIARRWTLNLKKISGSSEVDASVSVATTIRFLFPAFLRLSRSIADQRLIYHSAGGREPLPNASTTIAGRVILTQSGSTLGGINIQNAGAPLAGGPFHTINFPGGSGFVVQTTTGEVTIGQIGPTGPTGPSGQSGGTGPTGPTGPGFTQLNSWDDSSYFSNPGGTTNTYTHTSSLGLTIRVLAGGAATVRERGAMSTDDEWEITNVSGVGSTTAQIDFSLTNDLDFKAFFSAAGD